MDTDFLILSGIERFLIELIRINPRIAFGLSQAQAISIIMIIAGAIILYSRLNIEKKTLPQSA
ncbi:MAG: prolipoprotein diacylglyceryl transferase [Ignavibacteria bacterium]|nr:prolipoprotein diacylglyceryl transferase [Ignavibacteria bacterium]